MSHIQIENTFQNDLADVIGDVFGLLEYLEGKDDNFPGYWLDDDGKEVLQRIQSVVGRVGSVQTRKPPAEPEDLPF